MIECILSFQDVEVAVSSKLQMRLNSTAFRVGLCYRLTISAMSLSFTLVNNVQPELTGRFMTFAEGKQSEKKAESPQTGLSAQAGF